VITLTGQEIIKIKLLRARIAVAFVFPVFLSVCFVTSVHAAGTVTRVPSEPSIGGLTPEEYWDQQLQLHEWLMSELPEGTLDAPIRVPMTKQDRHAIANDTTAKPRPQRVGIVKRVGRTVKIWRGGPIAKVPARLSRGVIQGTDDGGFAWAVALESKNAAALRVHLSEVSLPDSADIYFFSLDGQAHGPYRGGDTFWTNSVMGTQGIVLVRQFGPPTAGTQTMSISVTSVGNMGEQSAAAHFPLCEYNYWCVEDAAGYDGTAVSKLKAATAHMEWVQGAWIYSCSGGLLADTDPSGQIPYFLTANHCLKSDGAARSLELYWDYTTTSAPDRGCSGPVGPMSTGGEVIATGVRGDFTLLKLTETPPGGRVYMGWTNEKIATMSGEILHRVHHPKGAPQSYSQHLTDSGFGTCAGLPIPQFIYSKDEIGTTEGGSSGSLVTNAVGEVVGQLYGGCGSNFDECFSDSWRTVDGAFSFYYDKVAPFLAASCDPLAPEICDDDFDNNCDTDIDCQDSQCTGDPACDEPICAPKNAACSTVNEDCCSGICKRNGRCR
jgi:hypothetical protein